MFGLKQTNHVWSWSAISKDGKTVATTVWADQVGRTNDPSLFVDTFNLPTINEMNFGRMLMAIVRELST